jgi:hypothetical protein
MPPIESLRDFVAGIVAYGGGTIAILYLCFQFFAKSWLESWFSKKLQDINHQHELEIHKLRFELDTMLSKKIRLQEREFVILPEAWSKLNAAHRRLIATTSPYQSYPDLNKLSKNELEEYLVATDFAASDKKKIQTARRPLDVYIELVTWKQINDVRKAIVEFKDYVDASGIFLPTSLKENFQNVSTKMWNAIITKEVGHESGDWKMKTVDVIALMKEITPSIKSIESEINAMLMPEVQS